MQEEIFHEEVDDAQISDIVEEIIGNIRRVSCTVDVPDDLYEDGADQREQRADYAIYVAREWLPDYCTPAEWHIVWDNGDEVRVVRESRAHNG